MCQLPTNAASLLGADFLEEAGAIISFESSKLIRKRKSRTRKRDDATEERAALKSSRRVKTSASPKTLSRRQGKGMNRPQPTPRSEALTPQGRSWLVKANDNIVLAPRCRQVVQGRPEMEGEQNLPPLVVVEPVQIPIQAIFPARALTHIEPSARQSSQVTSQASPKVIRRADRA